MSENKELIQNSNELFEWFTFMTKSSKESKQSAKRLEEGIMVTGKIRKEVLTSIGQGKIIVQGEVKRIYFTNLGGGVYLATFIKLQENY